MVRFFGPPCTFDWCQNQRPWMTLKGHYALCFKTRASFGANHKNLNEDKLYSQWRQCSPMTVDSDNIRFMRIFPGKGASYNSGVIKNFWGGFGCYVFGTLGNETNIIIQYYLVPCCLSTDPQNTWPWMTLNVLNGHFALYVHYYELPLTHYLLLIYCRLFITRDVTSGEVREVEYSKQWSAERQNIWNPRKICRSSMDAVSSEP